MNHVSSPRARRANTNATPYDFACADPGRVVDRLLELHRLRNDAALSRALGISPATICKIRTGKHGFSAGVVLRIHEALGMPVAELRALVAGEAPGSGA
jgi:plasmid maintenance system antidote protein VapI